MDGLHSVAWPGCVMQPGHASPLHCADLPAFGANDNLEKPRIAGVEAIELMLDTDAGTPIARLQARLKDGRRIILMTTRDADEFIALWRGLGRELNAPLEVIDLEGHARIFTHAPGALHFPRWRGSALSKRRTRASRRRLPPLDATTPATRLA